MGDTSSCLGAKDKVSASKNWDEWCYCRRDDRSRAPCGCGVVARPERRLELRFFSQFLRAFRDSADSSEKSMPARPLSSAQIISPLPSIMFWVPGKTKRNGTSGTAGKYSGACK